MRRTALGALLLTLVVAALVAVAVVVRMGADRPPDQPVDRPVAEPTPSASPNPSPSPTPSSTLTPPTTGPPSSQPTAPVPPTLSPCPPGPSRQLTVLTFNIHGGLGHRGYDLDTVANEIEAWDADVVLLQEVDRNRPRTLFDDQAVALATRLDMHPAYGANVRRPPAEPGGKGQEYGTLTLSRYPVLDSDNVHLPNRPGLERRGLLRTTIDVDGAPVDVFNTHLQHTSGAVRREQVRGIRAVLETRDLPTVVGGDLNAEPDSPALALLAAAGLSDPWPAVGVDEGLTVPARVPRRRIDFVLHDASFEPRAAEDLLSTVSDHRAVRVVLRLVDPRDCGGEGTS